jgi:ribosomal protein S27AE
MGGRVNPKNLKAEPIRVCHAELESVSDESPFRKKCPACGTGTLLVHRDQETFMLTNVDCCTLCGQTVIYSDKFINGVPVKDITVKPN